MPPAPQGAALRRLRLLNEAATPSDLAAVPGNRLELWLMPFDGRWFYGDALFIIDPWVLALGGVLFLRYSAGAMALALWAIFWVLGTWLLFAAPMVPSPSRVLWVAAVVAFVAVRIVRPQLGPPPVSERLGRVALGCVVVYIVAALAASAVARREVRSTLVLVR